ncbi:hypothetical protein TVAG_122880 [Trichomonas vaginalis G3]|uniref:Uncharacterized protein n=1 Tax=Trichomonas vaginalis (strain ATCC PRA-98 / G3) TaxID=412133 RepID=A2DN45_TRIV3|nr:protein ubiquitination [Trichomonas vaginalis G3]EAY18222.1 hypothetical protein TVAG_122880 [Trichomonas vaginalis G3]KAI5491527.1 protein ubiquitination [Trichomonas vaginalis G3]|eukprot:XP_001579208.1 hypothetical protein [Trichomonas vaginalis G3]
MVVIGLNNQILQRINDYNTSDKVVLSINNVEITINKSFAVAFSKTFYSQYLLDNSTDKIDANTDIESQDTYNILKDILQYRKTEFECNETILKDLFHIGLKLEMQELINLYETYVIDKMEIDKNNCFQILEFYFDISKENKISECIDFISSHFFEINLEQLKTISNKLGIDILKRIVFNDLLVMKDEDSFARCILFLADDNEIFYTLIESIHFEFCCDEIINKIYSLANSSNCMSFLKYFHDSIIRFKNGKQINPRAFNPEDFESMIEKYKDSNDFESIYKFFERLSEYEYQAIIYKSCKEGLFEICDNNDERNVLHEASFKGNLKLIQYLVSCGCNIEMKDKNGNTPLIIACSSGHLEVVKYFISIGANKETKTKSGNTPLIMASFKGHIEIVKYLILMGVNKESKNNYGNTPLLVASFYKAPPDILQDYYKNSSNIENLEVVIYLLSVGADKEAKNKEGSTPLIISSCKGHLGIVKYLVPLGANKEATDNKGNTPLILASTNNQLEIVKYLISVGANKDAKDNDGSTSLIIASMKGHLELVKYLISVGADQEVKNNEGKNALSYAEGDVRDFLLTI